MRKWLDHGDANITIKSLLGSGGNRRWGLIERTGSWGLTLETKSDPLPFLLGSFFLSLASYCHDMRSLAILLPPTVSFSFSVAMKLVDLGLESLKPGTKVLSSSKFFTSGILSQ